MQHLYQFQEHWITYRSTAEAWKHERFLYVAEAGPYVTEDRHSQLAERIEGLVSQEHAKWTASQRSAPSKAQRVVGGATSLASQSCRACGSPDRTLGSADRSLRARQQSQL